jgi:hypothetical protein
MISLTSASASWSMANAMAVAVDEGFVHADHSGRHPSWVL